MLLSGQAYLILAFFDVCISVLVPLPSECSCLVLKPISFVLDSFDFSFVLILIRLLFLKLLERLVKHGFDLVPLNLESQIFFVDVVSYLAVFLVLLYLAPEDIEFGLQCSYALFSQFKLDLDSVPLCVGVSEALFKGQDARVELSQVADLKD